jgi:hypothetical protein
METELYTVRVNLRHGVQLMPHKHPEDRVYTVLSGVFYAGLEDVFDPDKREAYGPSAVLVLPANTQSPLQMTAAIATSAGIRWLTN